MNTEAEQAKQARDNFREAINTLKSEGYSENHPAVKHLETQASRADKRYCELSQHELGLNNSNQQSLI